MIQSIEQHPSITESLLTVRSLIQKIPGFAEEVELLVQKAERLQHRQFTIALFGAFSAGKSSVANCLIGDMVLPVSPNPTTAAINRILPPTSECPHGTVLVQLKAKSDLWEDMKSSLGVLGVAADSLESALAVIDGLRPEGLQAHAKPHFSFLKAVVRGWTDLQEHLGSVMTIDIKQFKTFVAKEEKACFAEWIELYYDSLLAQNGIALVDTPGADSINARHTGVAFEYIKNADAILFVTYYNHAFGRADAEFLVQLGRVKDTFALDKMFFLVNASDLAQTEEELETVLKHVRQNLVRCGISMPRIYPVSSQTGLLARMMEKAKLPASAEKVLRQRLDLEQEQSLPSASAVLERFGIQRFEADFYRFIKEDLTKIANRSAIADIKRIAERLSELNNSAQADEMTRREQIQSLHEEQCRVVQLIDTFSADTEYRLFAQELDELVYYVKQRLFLKYRDAFMMAFNPSVLQDEYKDIKTRLRHCLQELVQSLTFTVQQEMRATSLRLETFNGKMLGVWLEKFQREVRQIKPAMHFREYEGKQIPTPDFPGQIEGDFSKVLSYYRNAKDFFEAGKKDVMRDELEQLLQEPVETLLKKNREILKQVHLDAWHDQLAAVRVELTKQINAYYEGLRSVLTAAIDLKQLQIALRQAQELHQHFSRAGI
ncbi:dynamin family protein [Fodinisporobacter ferrooxydans]|uniref:Dynamin family protein n=1 Tax=Fodinisporobacter ferrooxydans TaxID=2901836 RepID=A0ABY4CKY5_9BACL|nr:dynamin family protein [Alicyclobacillaceae bacterium MYW30-H2]